MSFTELDPKALADRDFPPVKKKPAADPVSLANRDFPPISKPAVTVRPKADPVALANQDFPPVKKPSAPYDPTAGPIYAGRSVAQERAVQAPRPLQLHANARPGELRRPTALESATSEVARRKGAGENFGGFALESLTPPSIRAALDNNKAGSTELDVAVIKDLGFMRTAGLVGKLAEGRFALTPLGQRWLSSIAASGPVKAALMRTFSPARAAGGAVGGGTYQAAIEAPQDKPLIEKAKAVGEGAVFGAAADTALHGIGEGRSLPKALRTAQETRQSFEGGKAALNPLRPEGSVSRAPVREPAPFQRGGQPFAGPTGEPVRPGPVTQEKGTAFKSGTAETLPKPRTMAQAMGLAPEPVPVTRPAPGIRLKPTVEAPAAKGPMEGRPVPGIRAPEPKPEPRPTRMLTPNATGTANQVQAREVAAGELPREPFKRVAGMTDEEMLLEGKRLAQEGHPDYQPESLAKRLKANYQPANGIQYGALTEGKRQMMIANKAISDQLKAAVESGDQEAIKRLQGEQKTADERTLAFLDDVQHVKGLSAESLRTIQAGLTLDHGDPANVIQAYEDKAGRKSTPEEVARLTKIADQIRDLQNSQEETAKTLADQAEELRAKRITTRQAKAEKAGARATGARGRAEVHKAERVKIEGEIKAYLDEVAGSAHSVTGIPYHGAKLAGAGSRWAISLARETGANLDAVVNQTIKDFHERGIALSKEELISELAARDETKTKDEKQSELLSLKSEARRHESVRARLEAARKGEKLQTDPRKKMQVSKSIADMEQELKGLLKGQRQEAMNLARAAKRAAAGATASSGPAKPRGSRPKMTQAEREAAAIPRLQTRQALAETGYVKPKGSRVSGSYPFEQQRASTLEAETHARAQARIADLDRQLKTGDYALPTAKERVMSEQRKKLAAKEQLLRNEVNLHIRNAKPLSAVQKVANVIGTPRSLMTTADLSAPGRQGWKLGLANPDLAKEAFAAQIRAFNPEKAVSQHMDLLNRENAHWYKRSGLHISPVGGAGLVHGEEAFIGNLAEKIPGYGKVVAGSERAYTAYLNRLRADTFDRMTSALGKRPREKDMQAIAEFINVATGRGRFGIKSHNAEGLLNGLNNAFFAPRKIAADLEYLPRGLTGGLSDNPEVRAAIQGSTIRTLGAVGAMLGLASLAGAKVSTDPRDSDFLKIHVGNTRIDIGTGVLQYLTLGARLATGQRRTGGGSVKPSRFVDTMMNFTRNKLAPFPADIADIGSYDRKKPFSWKNAGKDSTVQTLTGTDLIMRNLMPITASNLASKALKEGIDPEDLFQVLDFFGVSVNRYAKKKGQ